MKFDYFECPDCGWDCVADADRSGSAEECPLCAADSGHSVLLKRRPATDDDRPEGFDARRAA